jgi:hypothetical protein
MLEMLAAPACSKYAVNFFVVLAAWWKEISRGGCSASKRREVMQEPADFWEARVPGQAMLVEENNTKPPIVRRSFCTSDNVQYGGEKFCVASTRPAP